MRMNDMTVDNLIDLHNELYPNRKISSWKSKKAALIGVIKARSMRLGASKITEPDFQPAEEVEGRGKIKALTTQLLLDVVSYDDHGNAIGRPYEEIMEMILKEVPDATPSVKSLQWYASKIGADYALPKRPRKNARAAENEIPAEHKKESKKPSISKASSSKGAAKKITAEVNHAAA